MMALRHHPPAAASVDYSQVEKNASLHFVVSLFETGSIAWALQHQRALNPHLRLTKDRMKFVMPTFVA